MRTASACWIVIALVACSGKKEVGAGSASGSPGSAPAPAPTSTSAKGAPAAGTPTTEAPATATAPATTDAPTAPAGLDAAAAATATAAPGRPLYYDRAITDADLDGRSLRELSLMRNWIFARAGNPFRKQWLRDFFAAQPWYHAAAKVDESKLTALDHANAKRIADREGSFTHDQLVAMKDAIAAKPAPSADDQIELTMLSTRLGTWSGDTGAAGSGSGEGQGSAEAKHSPLEDPSRLDALLSLDDLANLSRRDLRILRNTVYARRGRPFKSELLQRWFGDMAWYQPDPDYTDARLTAIDQKNIHLIRSVEDQLGGPLSEHDQKDEEGWFAQS